jgi:hypothetical protein
MTEESQPPTGGVVISGGTVKIGALAQGPHAQASYREVINPAGDEREDLQALMRELLAVLRQHDSDLADAPSVHAAVDDVSGELANARPDRSRIRGLLDKIAAAAGPIADIAAAVATVQRAIGGM